MKRSLLAVPFVAAVRLAVSAPALLHAADLLTVSPTNLVFEVVAGDPAPTTQTIELQSMQSLEQSWYTSLSWPQLIEVDPASGTLAGNQKAALKVSVLSSNVWPSKGGYAGDISFLPWGKPKLSFQIKVRPSARLVSNAGALTFGMAPDGEILERTLTLRNTGYSTAGAGIVLYDTWFGSFFKVVKDPASDPAWNDRWSIYIDISGQNLVLTNNESRSFPVRARYDWRLPPGHYRATLATDDPSQLAEPLAIPLELVVGEDRVAIERLTPVPGTVLAEGSKVVFEAQALAQVQSVESADVRLTVFDPTGVSAIGYSDWVKINRSSDLSNLVLQTPPVTIHRYSNVIVKASMAIPHDGYDWVYSEAFVYPVGTNAPVTNIIALGETLRLPGSFTPVSTNHVKVQFERSTDGINYVVEAPIEALTATSATVRVPVNLLGPSKSAPPAVGFSSNVLVRVITGLPGAPQTNTLPTFQLLRPRLLIHDEVLVAPALPAGAAPQVVTSPGTLLQFRLNSPANVNDPATVATFMFQGQSTDGRTVLRTLNSALRALATSPPLRLSGQVRVFQPNSNGVGFEAMTPFQLLNLLAEDQGLQFDVSRDGLYVIVVGSEGSSSGPFPAPFQIHLAGNVGLPRKLVDGTAETPRGTRLDILFNHPAPRTRALAATPVGSAETAPFKFANLASAYPFAAAVLVPPTPNGFPLGTRVIRAPDPTNPLDITTPTARSAGASTPGIGMVIDFTQLPDPASVVSAPSLSGTVGAVIGQGNGSSVTLPLTLGDGTQVLSLILDAGSGHEIADGAGADFRILATSGTYTVAVANTPYVGDWVQLGGPRTDQSDVDLAGSGLGLARFVMVTAAPTVTLDAVHKLNMVCDSIDTQIGALTHVTSATVLVRRAKAPETTLDPFVQLVGPDGELYGENESGFGDDTSLDLSDLALTRISLRASSFYRFLVKGYDQTPDQQSVGSFFTRLETDGNYDPVELTVSTLGEAATDPQKQGTLSQVRQRDSFLFQAKPGTSLHIVVNARTAGLDPLVELYDPEDFLLGANDSAPGRGRNALLTIALPTLSAVGAPLPANGTYRIVVQAADSFGNAQGASFGSAYPRISATGQYDLKVFTGATSTSNPGPVEPATRQANVWLHCRSLRFQTATVQSDGQTLTLQLDSSFAGDKPNGELYPFEEESPTHSSSFVLSGPSLPEAIVGDLYLDVPPTTDNNSNRVPDFFESSQPIANATTLGAFETESDTGDVVAVWNRAAGATTGSCRLSLHSDEGLPIPDFNAAFELVEYKGQLFYQPSTNRISGLVTFQSASTAADTLAGPVQLSRSAVNRFDVLQLDAGSWTNTSHQPWGFDPVTLTRSTTLPKAYSGALTATDGDLTTATDDFCDWFIAIEDPNDTDHDGIADLSDDVSPVVVPEGPRLAAAPQKAGNSLLLRMDGRVGSTVLLESCNALGSGQWSTLSSWVLTADTQTIELPIDAGVRFYRLREL